MAPVGPQARQKYTKSETKYRPNELGPDAGPKMKDPTQYILIISVCYLGNLRSDPNLIKDDKVQVQLVPTLTHPYFILYLTAHLNEDVGVCTSVHPHIEGHGC